MSPFETNPDSIWFVVELESDALRPDSLLVLAHHFAGVGLLTVSALLGHTQVTTTDTCLASSPTVGEEN